MTLTVRSLAKFSVCLSLTIFGAALLTLARPAAAHEGEHEFTEKVQHKPTPLPDRVVLSWSGDPTSSIDVTWRTDTTVDDTVAEFARADILVGNLRSGDVPHSSCVEGSKQQFSCDLGTCHIHSAHLQGLEPATMYAYRVGNGQMWSEWFQFRTASKSDDPFTFVYFGDAQNALRSMWSRVIREANQHAPRAAFMLHAGDLVNRANRDADWGEWFGAGAWLNGMIPVVATPGNHEYDDGLSLHWRPQFAFPLNGPSGLEETVYWIDYQAARIISLNSNECVERQIDWLISVLSDQQRPNWTIATFHHPIFSGARGRDNERLRSVWRPVLEKYGVDLVLQGHDHTYARSGLGGPTNVNLPEGVRRTSSNTVYVVSVSGPKMYALQKRWEMSRVASGVQLFQVIHVSPKQLRYEARLATGDLYDAFTLDKGEDGTTIMTEQIPSVAEFHE